MKKQKLSKVTIYKNEKKVSITVAPYDVHPTVYTSYEYKKGDLPLKDNLRYLCLEVVKGIYLPTDGCELIPPKKVNLALDKLDEAYKTYPYIYQLLQVPEHFPADLNNITDKYRHQCYQIFGNYLSTLCFPAYYPFTEEQMSELVNQWTESFNKRISYLFEQDLTKIRQDNFQKKTEALDIPFMEKQLKEYFKNKMESETDNTLKQFYQNKMDKCLPISVSNLDDALWMYKQLSAVFEKEEDFFIQNKE